MNKRKWFTPITTINSKTEESESIIITSDENKNNKKPKLETNVDSVDSVLLDSFIINCKFTENNLFTLISPKTISELCVHPKKIEELEKWFQSSANEKNNPILILNGPSGVGKTQTLRILAKNYKYEIKEWITPVDNGESQLEQFQKFLLNGSRYKNFFLNENLKNLVLVKDFPNYFVRFPEKFIDILERYNDYGKSPIVFITTETKSKILNLNFNLFSETIKNQLNIQQINFNPISTTLMKKCLKRISNIFSQNSQMNLIYNQPTQDIIDSLIVSAQGDLRNAILNLFFISQKGKEGSQFGCVEKKTKSKNSNKIKSIGTDESITLMHGLGRVLNPKYSTEDNSKRKTLLYSPENLTDSFLSQPKQFISLLHANYLDHYEDINDVTDVLDNLCVSDKFFNDYRDDALGMFALNIGIRSVMVLNERPKSGWKPIRAAKRTDKLYALREQEKCNLIYPIATDIFALDYRSYAKLINS